MATGSAIGPQPGREPEARDRSELSSSITRDAAQVLSDDPGVMKDVNGRALSSPELIVVANMRRKNGADTNVTVRGASQMAFTVRTGMTVTDGRNFQPGLYEVLVGRKVFERIEGMEIGRSFKLQRRDWKIVGDLQRQRKRFRERDLGRCGRHRSRVQPRRLSPRHAAHA